MTDEKRTMQRIFVIAKLSKLDFHSYNNIKLGNTEIQTKQL
jgi:hypothetical protein